MNFLSARNFADCHSLLGKAAWLPIILLLALSACSKKETLPSAAPQSAVGKKSKIVCLGRLVPGERVIQVAAPAGAIIKELNVKRGDRVKKGQIIATLRDEEALRASVVQLRREVAVADAQLAQVEAGEKPATILAQQAVVARCEAELARAAADYRRMQGLYDEQIISQAQLDEAQANWASARERVREAKEQLTSLKWVRPEDVAAARKKLAAAEATLARAEADLELNFIRAPLDSQVIEINTYPGETVGAHGVVDLADTRNMMVEAEVYITDIERVSVGSPARVKVEGFSGELSGKVTEIVAEVNPNVVFNPDPDSFVDRRVVKTRIRLDDGDKVASLINSEVTVEIEP
jgi:HlyD family secretion protein